MANKPTAKKNHLLPNGETIAQNRRARFDYSLEEQFEAGIELTGTEVKSLRLSQASIAESYIEAKNGELFLINAMISEYAPAGDHLQHYPTRKRRLLMRKREINKLSGAVQKEGMSIIPLSLFFNKHGRIKLSLALAKGKKQHDKRQTQKDRDWNRQKSRLMKEH